MTSWTFWNITGDTFIKPPTPFLRSTREMTAATSTINTNTTTTTTTTAITTATLISTFIDKIK